MKDYLIFGDDEDRDLPAREGERSVWWEVSGTVVGLAAIFVTVGLVANDRSGSLVGPVGAGTTAALQFLLGSFVSFLVPAALLVLSIQLFRGRVTRFAPARFLGLVLLLLAITGLLALPDADNPDYRRETMERAGAVGTFMVEWDGLRLVGAFGAVGATMILSAIGLFGLALTAHLRLSELLIAALSRRWLPERSAATGVDVTLADADTDVGIDPEILEEVEPDAPTDPAMDMQDEPDAPADTEDASPSRPFFRRLFRGSRPESVLAAPDPEEEEELAEEEFFDEDAAAAARALEEARIDEEYELALRQSSDGEDEDILFTDHSQSLDLIEGNPVNEAKVGEGLAKLFPTRWENDEGGVVRREQKEGEDDSDPLFAEGLDTRPAGAMAALEAASVSAMEDDERLAARNRQLAEYRLPDVQLLDSPPVVDARMPREEMLEISQTLEKTFADFGIQLKVIEVKQGPVVTRFELRPAPGVKVSRIVSLEHDIALAMKAVSVRIVAPIPGKAAVGVEVPNRKRAGVYLKELVSAGEFWDHPSPLGFALGKTIEGLPYFADLKKMPHLLIAGATGAGKSVCLNTIICSFLYRMRPDRLRLLLVDPKRVEMSIYEGIPHLISPVVCEPKAAAAALHWAVEQMEERYKTLVEFRVRNIDGYNEIALDPDRAARHGSRNPEVMPHMVIVVDELADLMVVAKNEVEESIQRLAQMARAVGIHLILATQRPSVNVITGIIKANFPTRIAFQVRQKVDSRTILDAGGAEALLGRGDMLYAPAGAAKPQRIQGAFVSDGEVERLVGHCKSQAEPMYDVEEFEPLLSEKEQRELARLMGANVESMDDLDEQDRVARGTNRTMGRVSAGMFVPHDGGSAQAGDEEIDEALVRAAARVILEGRKGSTSLVQRRLKVGFARAGRLMDMLEEMGIVGPYKGSKPREILVDPDAAMAQLDALEEQIKRSGSSARAAAELDGEAG